MILLAFSAKRRITTLRTYTRLRKLPNPITFSHNQSSTDTNGNVLPISTVNLPNSSDSSERPPGPLYLKLPPLHLLTVRTTRRSVVRPSSHLPRNTNNIFDWLAYPSPVITDIRLQPYYRNWSVITNDSWVLKIVSSGYRLEFTEYPPLGRVQYTASNSILEEEVHSLLQKGAIQAVPTADMPNGFYSRYFAVTKKDGGMRPILDLRDLNTYLLPRRFRMVTLESITHLLKRKHWFVLIDLKDAYFHITIHPDHRRFLRFVFQNTIYQYLALPFGLATAPRTFTKCMAPVAAYLRLNGIHVFPYIDDWLVVSPSRRRAFRDTKFILRLLNGLGLTVNHKKSRLFPSKVVHYIGAKIDARKGRIFLPRQRIHKIRTAIRKFRPGRSVSAKHAQHLLGLMSSTTSAVSHARLKLRSLQIWLLTLFNPLQDHQGKKLLVSKELVQQLQWWAFPPHLQVGRPFRPLRLTAQITTDASPTGWGAHCGHRRVHALWSHQERSFHINHLEILAVFKALKAFFPLVRGRGVQVVTDNTTAMYYINKQGGTHSPSLLFLTVTLWEWCYQNHVFPVAVHLSTEDNFLADQLSRRLDQMHEWELDMSVFNQLCQRWGKPLIDLFASHQNAKCPLYASRAGLGRNSLGDAFMLSWKQGLLYAFPPFPLIQRTLVQLHHQSAEAILVTPFWPRQPWFPTLVDMAVDSVRLPSFPALITQDAGTVFHPDLHTLRLTAWRISRRSRRS